MSHASENKEFAIKLFYDFRNLFLKPWIDIESLDPGTDWNKDIKTAIESCEYFVFCISKISAEKSGYIENEIKWALDEALKRKIKSNYFIPILIEEGVDLTNNKYLNSGLSDYQISKVYNIKNYDKFFGFFRKNKINNSLFLIKINSLINEFQLEQCFNSLKTGLDKGNRNYIVLNCLLFSYKQNEKDKQGMLVSNENYLLERARVIRSLNEIIGELSNE
ncbi:MAG: toll/interleukin-1 receptor domain-containing protein [Saprospiraceae bacterium]|nr:toll/interleukin-1 receptor domain-containing protein [Saprospiraceae bacterium]